MTEQEFEQRSTDLKNELTSATSRAAAMIQVDLDRARHYMKLSGCLRYGEAERECFFENVKIHLDAAEETRRQLKLRRLI